MARPDWPITDIHLCRRGLPAWSVLLAIACACGTGCVQRRMTIRSNPPGALVYVDDFEIGVTPVSTNFTYYGQRKIRLVKDGYETLTVIQPVVPPWYEIPPIDFISENFTPGQIRDQHVFDYQLRPQAVVPTEQLLGRAEQLRRGVQTGVPGQLAPPVPGTRINPQPPGPGPIPIPSSEPIVTPPPVGGQPIYPLPEGR